MLFVHDCSSSFVYGYGDPRDLHSFPTRRSSDLMKEALAQAKDGRLHILGEMDKALPAKRDDLTEDVEPAVLDRKSTRLNSSHANISYAVFCLKKKKIKNETNTYE